MFGLPLQQILLLLLLAGFSNAGLVSRRSAKEATSSAATLVPAAELHKDRIPVTILYEPELQNVQKERNTEQIDLKMPAELQPTTERMTTETEQIDVVGSAITTAEIAEDANTAVKHEQELSVSDPVTEAQLRKDEETITERIELPLPITFEREPPKLPLEPPIAIETADATEKQQPLQLQEASSEDKPVAVEEPSAPLSESNSLKALPTVSDVLLPNPNQESLSLQDEAQRQATQATPTQTTTQQNFVQQFIQNSPIGQFLSQFTGGQQQQQQVQADEPATPAPTLPGFLNPSVAITSAQQAVQNAAQSVVNSTTQAFQGLQQFATNLGTQFQNTFSNLAGQQNQLTTVDSTTNRPPGPIQTIVSNFVGGSNNQGSDGAAAPPGQPQGPLQGILSFFQGGNRPQNSQTGAPPKEEPVTPAAVDDKVEVHNDDIAEQTDQQEQSQQQETEADNEVRNSEEFLTVDSSSSLEDAPVDELIVVNDDSTQQNVSA